MDTKKTLQNLHQKFPEMTLDDLFTILDCIVLDNPTPTSFPNNLNKFWYNTEVTCKNS